MKAEQVKTTAEICIAGHWVFVSEEMTVQQHIDNARRLKAEVVQIGDCFHYPNGK